MSWLVPLALFALCVTDAGFAGFRDAAGRDARIFKAELFRRAIRRGLLHGILAGALGLGIALGATLLVPFDDLLEAARWMLLPLAGYATLVLAALGVWATAEADLRTLASVVVLGPFTLVRPLVIASAAFLGAWHAPSWPARGAVAAVCALQLAIEPWLGRARRPR
jgi:hypothetical protein